MALPALAVILAVAAPPRPPFDAGRAPFPVRVRGQDIPYRVLAVSVMPEEEVLVEATLPRGEPGGFEVDGVPLPQDAVAGRWRWKAPPLPGLHAGRVSSGATGESVELNFFVLVPAARVSPDGVLDGYRIGTYPAPRKGKALDAAPPGFIEVTRANQATPVSPHFTLGQFLCHQESAYPKFLVLGGRLLRKLELLLEAVNAEGVRSDGFAVLSGYRTPDYNERIRDVAYSRHLWGDAADVFVDEDRDGRLDDLDGDGSSGTGDADRLLAIFEQAAAVCPELGPLEGGLGPYAPSPSRGPFVHVDARGTRARWRG